MKGIPFFDGYFADDDGQILSTKQRGVKRRKAHLHDGYLRLKVKRNDGKPVMMLAHRLVALAYHPNPKNLPEVNHLDGDKLNNRPNNLEWCDGDHNHKHARSIGKKGKIFFTDEQVAIMLSGMYSIKRMSIMFNVNTGAIYGKIIRLGIKRDRHKRYND